MHSPLPVTPSSCDRRSLTTCLLGKWTDSCCLSLTLLSQVSKKLLLNPSVPKRILFPLFLPLLCVSLSPANAGSFSLELPEVAALGGAASLTSVPEPHDLMTGLADQQ